MEKINPHLLISDEDIVYFGFDGKPENGKILTKEETALAIRDHYEDLIAEGRLVAVNEVELYHPSVPDSEIKEWMDDPSKFAILMTRCCKKNPMAPNPIGCAPWMKYPYCPGCGGKISKK